MFLLKFQKIIKKFNFSTIIIQRVNWLFKIYSKSSNQSKISNNNDHSSAYDKGHAKKKCRTLLVCDSKNDNELVGIITEMILLK